LWQIEVPSLKLTLQIKPYLADQEWNVSYVYWEGTVSCTGQRGEMQIAGQGYIELTGYVGSMQGQL
jgi:predicted secreted hydrolase